MAKLTSSFAACRKISWYHHFGWLMQKVRVHRKPILFGPVIHAIEVTSKKQRKKIHLGAESCSLQHKHDSLTHAGCSKECAHNSEYLQSQDSRDSLRAGFGSWPPSPALSPAGGLGQPEPGPGQSRLHSVWRAGRPTSRPHAHWPTESRTRKREPREGPASSQTDQGIPYTVSEDIDFAELRCENSFVESEREVRFQPTLIHSSRRASWTRRAFG